MFHRTPTGPYGPCVSFVFITWAVRPIYALQKGNQTDSFNVPNVDDKSGFRKCPCQLFPCVWLARGKMCLLRSYHARRHTFPGCTASDSVLTSPTRRTSSAGRPSAPRTSLRETTPAPARARTKRAHRPATQVAFTTETSRSKGCRALERSSFRSQLQRRWPGGVRSGLDAHTRRRSHVQGRPILQPRLQMPVRAKSAARSP